MTAEVTITHPERVIFPESGETKGELAAYHAAIAAPMLRHAGRRPLSLVRCPEGAARPCFFQKHRTAGFGEPVHGVAIAEKGGATEDYMWVDSAAGFAACVQMGTIEFHGWGSHADDLEHPDRMVFDLDPAPEIAFAAVRDAARDVRDRLAAQGLASFAMLTGGKGIHVVVPFTAGHSWDAHGDFAQALAEAFAESQPDRFVATMSKAKREGRIFIDWLRNRRGNTAIMPYSARARTGAPVAAPVGWEELDSFAGAQAFSISDADALVARAGGRALAGWGAAKQRLPRG